MSDPDCIQFEVRGNPKAQKRHRTYTKGKGGRALTFARQVDPSNTDKADFIAQAMQNAPDSPWEGPLSLRLAFYFPRPTSHFGTGKNADRLKASAPKHHTKRPDADNLAKLVKDAMNGVFYLDDAQVVRLRVKKEYSRTPRTFVMLRRLK